MGCFVVAEFLLTSASRGPSAIAEPLVCCTMCDHNAPVLQRDRQTDVMLVARACGVTVELLYGVVEGDCVWTVDERVSALDDDRRARDPSLPQHVVQDRLRHLTVQVTDVYSIHRTERILARVATLPAPTRRHRPDPMPTMSELLGNG